MDKRVEIHGTSRADMNGKRGVATDFHWYEDDESKWRYTVQLDSGETFKFKVENVGPEGLAQMAPLLHRRVEIHGEPKDMNGMLGVAFDVDVPREIYNVRFDDGTEMWVPSSNVRAEGASSAGKAEGAGKGKKGRGGGTRGS